MYMHTCLCPASAPPHAANVTLGRGVQQAEAAEGVPASSAPDSAAAHGPSYLGSFGRTQALEDEDMAKRSASKVWMFGSAVSGRMLAKAESVRECRAGWGEWMGGLWSG